MPKIAKQMDALQVKRITKNGRHAVGGAPGLHLQVSNDGNAKSWIVRTVVNGKRRDVGLGTYPVVGLKEAREFARGMLLQVAQGIDPVEARKDARKQLIAKRARMKTFRDCALQVISEKEAGWKNPKHKQQWRNTLETYAFPTIGSMLISEIEVEQVSDILRPIWHKKPETAKRVLNRLDQIFNWAIVHNYRSGLSPARWRNHMDKLFVRTKGSQKHHKAVEVKDVGRLFYDIRQKTGVAAKALQFAALTAARSGEVRGATWSEIDMDKATWTLPGERMKGGREHRVPLSKRAVEILEHCPRQLGNDLVFLGMHGKMLSDMSMLKVLRDMGLKDTTHGFRSTFRDWAAEHTNHPFEIGEMALAHAIQNKAEAAYRRGDLFEKRREMMSEWADFCYAYHPQERVVPIHKVKKK